MKRGCRLCRPPRQREAEITTNIDRQCRSHELVVAKRDACADEGVRSRMIDSKVTVGQRREIPFGAPIRIRSDKVIGPSA